MPYNEIPTDDTVVAALSVLEKKGKVTALQLCEELVKKKYPRRDCQLAIQRTAERGRIIIEHDWSLTVAKTSKQMAVAG
jgi:hypothetical protein